MELLVHRAMYHAASEREGMATWAIVHAHTLYTIAASLVADHIAAVDSEAKYLFPSGVPVITADETIASAEIADKMATLVAKGGNIAVVKGHGPFAMAEDLEKAYRLISVLEHDCRVAYLASTWRMGAE